MANLTADRMITYSYPGEANVVVKTGNTIYAGAFVCIDATGYGIVGANAADVFFAGFAIAAAAAGENCRVRTDGIVNAVASGADQTWVGAMLTLSDDQTVALSTVSTDVMIGRCTEVVSATEVKFSMRGFHD